jgi:hypothetical protein
MSCWHWFTLQLLGKCGCGKNMLMLITNWQLTLIIIIFWNRIMFWQLWCNHWVHHTSQTSHPTIWY